MSDFFLPKVEAQQQIQSGLLRQRIQQRLRKESDEQKEYVKTELANVDVAIWYPPSKPPYPLVIFSHGFHGTDTQSKFIMSALANSGYLVIAPNHKDAINNGMVRVQTSFAQADKWSSKTYADRKTDIKNIVGELHSNPQWASKIDWSKFALAGHSLGGYTVLGLAGAWQDWKLPEVKAVLGYSPYCAPFLTHHTLNKISIPVMLQGGTRDFGITPSLKRKDGAFEQANSPAYFIEFQDAVHFSWTNFKKDKQLDEPIAKYSIAFLDKYLQNKDSTILKEKLPGVSILEMK